MRSNIIAIVWDFDKTLVDGYMQDPIFEHYNVDSKSFWNEVDELHKFYEDKFNIRVNRETLYLNHFITCARQGIFKGLNNEKLRGFGKDLKFYEGVPEIFEATKNYLKEHPKYSELEIKVEHYIVSTGISEIIRGSIVSEYVDGIWGCEFTEYDKPSKLDGSEEEEFPSERIISQVAYTVDNTTKTRALFEINKGVNKFPGLGVNTKVPQEDRRIPFENMIYIADGPSDVPAFSIIRKSGGKTFAVYKKGSMESFKQVDNLIKEKRIAMYAEADYREKSTAYMWIMCQLEEIAEKLYREKQEIIQKNVKEPLKHLD